MKTFMEQECADTLLEIFSCNVVSSSIVSNQDTQFMGYLIKYLCKSLVFQQIRTTPHQSQANRTVEIFHRTLVPMLLRLCQELARAAKIGTIYCDMCTSQ